MLADVEVVAFHLNLGAADGLGNQLVLNGQFLVHSAPTHDRLYAVAPEALHQLVFQRHVELGTARVTLTSGPTPELVVDPPCVVVLGAHNVQPAKFDYPIVLGLPGRVFGVAAAKDDIGTATGHVGGYGYRSQTAGLSYDCRLLFVVLGVQHLVGYSPPLQ